MIDTTVKNIDRSEAYWAIVWRQFKKNRMALASLWILAPVALAAIFAPLLASNQPFAFYDGSRTIYPWIHAIFNPEESVDYFFNMAMLGFVPWMLIAMVVNGVLWLCGVSGRIRAFVAFCLFMAITISLSILFLLPSGVEKPPYLLRPSNPYAGGEPLVKQQFRSDGMKWGVYPPIPFGPLEVDIESQYRPPGFRKPVDQWHDANDGQIHWLGTDNVGRDVLVRMIYGTRLALSVGFVAVGLYVTIGIIIGAIAGYFGGWTDLVISRAIEVMMLFPSFFLILTLVAMIGPSIYIIMVVIGVTRWTTMARLIRGEVLKQRSIDYTHAARALGASHMRIVFRHILPNAVSPAMVAIPFGISSAIIVEAGLSLLGFGVQPPAPSWGVLLKLGSQNYSYWWLVVIPSIAIFMIVTLFNLIGNGLRDAMDPRLRR